MRDTVFKKLNKLSSVMRTEFQRQLQFRADMFFYRISDLVQVVALIVVWTAAFNGKNIISGYNYEEMMTYVIVGWLMIFMTKNYSFDAIVASKIYDGTLSSFLLMPVDFIKYIITMSVARSSLAMATGVIMQIVIIASMHESLLMPSSLASLAVVAVMLVLGYFINLLIYIMIGMAAFWTTDIGGISYSARTIIRFIAGEYFPINMLPAFYVKLSLFMPFSYIFYVPIQLYLGKIPTADGFRYLGVEAAWLALLYGIIYIIWKRGLKRFEGVGI